jgi:hypothetical protein
MHDRKQRALMLFANQESPNEFAGRPFSVFEIRYLLAANGGHQFRDGRRQAAQGVHPGRAVEYAGACEHLDHGFDGR